MADIDTRASLVRLEFCSCLDMLEPVRIVTDHVGRMVGLNEDELHGVSVAVRESVINAVTHGNRRDRRKRVFIEFASDLRHATTELVVHVRDEGAGFDPSQLADPCAPKNVLKADGRGVFLIRSFMDEVMLQKTPEGGMEIRMVKRVHR